MNNESNLFLDLIKNKRVAIVGPSSSLVKQNLGPTIDSYDIVIRINKFKRLTSQPTDYGKKIDILYYNFHNWEDDFPQPAQPLEENELKKIKLIKAAQPLQMKHPDIQGEIKVARGPCTISNLLEFNKCVKNNNHIVHQKYSKEIINKFFLSNLFTPLWFGGIPSSGFFIMIELLYFLDDIKELGIFGIDFGKNKYNNKYSTNNPDNNGTFGEVHNMLNEGFKFKEIYENINLNLKKKIKWYDKDFLCLLNQPSLKRYGPWVLFYSNNREIYRHIQTGVTMWKPDPFIFSIPVSDKKKLVYNGIEPST